MTTEREIAIEQAAAALLSEAKRAGLDLSEIAEKAKAGIMSNELYTWVSADRKTGSVDAVDYLLQSVR